MLNNFGSIGSIDRNAFFLSYSNAFMAFFLIRITKTENKIPSNILLATTLLLDLIPSFKSNNVL